MEVSRSNDEINIQVDLRKTENDITQGAHQSADGRFRIVVFGESGQRIDQCEQGLFAVNYPAISSTARKVSKGLP